MPIAIVCPACGIVSTYHRSPVATCANCQTALPAELRSSAEATLARQRLGRPLLLTIGIYVAPVFGAFTLAPVGCAIMGAGDFTINDQSVGAGEFLLRSGPFLGGLGLLAFAIAYGSWREYLWTRWTIVAYWAVALAGGAGFGWSQSGLGGASAAMASSLLPALLATWYCFGKENVVDYYAALEALEKRRSPENIEP